ncbi:cobalt-precorrin-5B (C(1))-methyltransferase [Marinagarivorans algicola]|uniref:cobalt-precorrin-5B (C(1))-methyltransferase n=1 Tax=Marinagarivorans algicola TaxID=1513270 RepID=UPI003736D810
MWEESTEKPKPLRTGLTTGTCATACTLASARYLLSYRVTAAANTPLCASSVKKSRDQAAQTPCAQTSSVVSVTLPKGKTVELKVVSYPLGDKAQLLTGVRSTTIKDAGDDPDVTHGATVFADVVLQEAQGIVFCAGTGVGTVTREGLVLSVGEPAINPVPRQMMTDNLLALAQELNYHGGFKVTIGVEKGEVIAQKTMNARLGIVGGLSILGTTGIVRPFSCAAWIASIHQSIDVAKANGIEHIAASTGNRSEQAIQAKYQLDDIALIEMGDFAGAVLKHIKKHPIAILSLCGGFGKITKLANGHMDLNSRVSTMDFDHIAEVAGAAGADLSLQTAIKTANTSIEALKFCMQQGVPLAHAMCQRALAVARRVVPASVHMEVLATNRQGDFIGHAGVVLERVSKASVDTAATSVSNKNTHRLDKHLCAY